MSNIEPAARRPLPPPVLAPTTVAAAAPLRGCLLASLLPPPPRPSTCRWTPLPADSSGCFPGCGGAGGGSGGGSGRVESKRAEREAVKWCGAALSCEGVVGVRSCWRSREYSCVHVSAHATTGSNHLETGDSSGSGCVWYKRRVCTPYTV